MTSAPFVLPPFTASYAPDDCVLAARLLETARLNAARDERIDGTATRLIDAIRASDDRLGGVEDMLREYCALHQGRPGADGARRSAAAGAGRPTADQFIEDKLGQGDFVAPRDQIQRVAGQRVGVGARHVGARHSARRDPGRHDRAAGQAARPAGGARRDPPGDAADGQPFRARRDHRSGAGAGAPHSARRASLFLRHARRRRAHRRGRGALFQFLRRRDRRHRPRRRRPSAARSARHLGQAVRAASALRGVQPRAGDGRTGAAAARSGAAAPRPST